MDGVITSKDVLVHLPLIWKEYGTGCALRALKAVVTRQRTTFLDVACGAPERKPAQAKQPRTEA